VIFEISCETDQRGKKLERCIESNNVNNSSNNTCSSNSSSSSSSTTTTNATSSSSACELKAKAQKVLGEAKVNSVTPKEYLELRNRGDPHVLLDVRETVQYEICNLPQSVNIPLSKLQASISCLSPGSTSTWLLQIGEKLQKSVITNSPSSLVNVQNQAAHKNSSTTGAATTTAAATPTPPFSSLSIYCICRR